MSAEKIPKRELDQLARMEAAFDKIDRLLYRLGVQGLQRMSEASADELRALIQVAHNASLIRIERELEKINTYTRQYLDRDPLFRMSAYMDAINRVWLLNRAARKARARGERPKEMLDLIGEARRVYAPVGEPLELQPLAASGWVTDTGFVGVTLYMKAQGEEGLLQISNARPTLHFGDDPRQLYGMGVSDIHEETFRDLAHRAWCFVGAKRSRDDRLSVHKDLQIGKSVYLGARAYQTYAVDRWREALARIQAAERSPLPTSAPVFILITPAEMGPLQLDQKRGEATATLKDESGAEMTLWVPMRAENNFLIDNLEHMLAPKGAGAPPPMVSKGRRRRKVGAKLPRILPDALFGRITVVEDQLRFHPMTGIFDEAVSVPRLENKRVNEIHLSLEDLRGVKRGRKILS